MTVYTQIAGIEQRFGDWRDYSKGECLLNVLLRMSFAVIKHQDQKKLGEERVESSL